MELSEYASKLRELADIIEEQDKKFYVQVIDSRYGFLNRSRKCQEYFTTISSDTDLYQTEFTKTEIEDLKTNPVLKAINWDEVKLIPAD